MTPEISLTFTEDQVGNLVPIEINKPKKPEPNREFAFYKKKKKFWVDDANLK